MPTDDRPRVFLSYGHRDATELALALHDRLEDRYAVWQDAEQIRAGYRWTDEIRDGLRTSDILVALLTPHAVRSPVRPGDDEGTTSICLDEISYARDLPIPILPVLAENCEVPFPISHVQYVDLPRWNESDTQRTALFDTVVESVAALLGGEERLRDWWSLPEPWDFTAFLEDRRRDFHGRDWLFAKFEDWLSTSRQPALLAVGDPGIGKSALVAEWVHRNPGGRVLAYHCCQWDVRDTLDAGRFVRSIAAMIGSRLPAYAEMLDGKTLRTALDEAEVSEDPGSALEAAILNPLAKLPAPPQGRCCLLIDALDEGLSEPGEFGIVELLGSRLARFPDWLAIVATTRDERRVLDRFGGSMVLPWSAGDEMNEQDLAGFLDDELPGRDDLQLQVAALSQGIFLVARLLVDALESGQLDAKTVQKLPPGLDRVWTEFFSRMFERAGVDYEPSQYLLEAVVAAQRPRTRPELANAAGLDKTTGLPPLLDRLAPFLPCDGGTYRLFHRKLYDWLTGWDLDRDRSLAGPYHVPLRGGHERWADVGWQNYVGGPDDEADAARLDVYDLEFLPVHLGGAGRWPELTRVMDDDRFTERQIRTFPLRPRLPVVTVRAALRGALAESDAVRALDCLWHHAPSVSRRIGARSPIVALRHGDDEGALALARLGEPRERTLQLLMLAWELDERNRRDEAERVLQALIDLRPEEMHVTEAEIAQIALISLSGSHLPTVRALRGPVLGRWGDLLDRLVASDHTDRAMELATTDEETVRVMAVSAVHEANKSRFDAAAETLQRLAGLVASLGAATPLEVRRLHPWAIGQVAAAHARAQDVDTARRYLGTVPAAWVPEAVAAVGEGLAESGLVAEAGVLFRDYLRRWARARVVHRSNMFENVAGAQARTGFLDEAERSLAGIDPVYDGESARLALAEAYARRGDRQDALAQVAALDRRRTEGYVRVARVDVANDALDRALTLARKAGPSAEFDVREGIVTQLVEDGRIGEAESAAGPMLGWWARPSAFREIVAAWTTAGDLQSAERCITRVPPGFLRTEGRLRMALALAESGRGADARALAASTRSDESAGTDHARNELVRQVVGLQIRAGRTAEAEATAEAVHDPLERVASWRALARDCHDRGDVATARTWWDRIADLAPDAPKHGKMIWWGLAEDQMRCGEADLAFESAGRITDGDASAFYLQEMGRVARDGGRTADAIRAFSLARDRIAKLGPDVWSPRQRSLEEIARALVELGDRAGADATGRVPNSGCDRGAIGAVVASAHAQSGDIVAARSTLEEAQQLLEPFAEVLRLRFSAPLEYIDQTVRLADDPELGVMWEVAAERALCRLAEAQARVGERAAAQRTVECLMTQRGDAWTDVGRALADIGAPVEAADALVRARACLEEKKSSDPGGLGEIAAIQAGLGLWEDAATTCRRAEQLTSAAGLWTEFGAAASSCGLTQEADDAFARAAKLAAVEADGDRRSRFLSGLAIAQIGAGRVPSAMVAAEAIDSNRASHVVPVLQSLQECGADDAFSDLLGACLSEEEACRRACPLILERYSSQYGRIAEWLARTSPPA